MMLLCYIFPPLAVLLMGRPFSAILNVFLTVYLFYIPGVKHALACYADWKADRKFGQVVDAINYPEHARAERVARNSSRRVNVELPPPVDNPYVGKNGTVFSRLP